MYRINYRAYISLLCIIFFLFLVFPIHFYRPAAPGLDPSYIIAIHLAYKYHLLFGKDIVFTFGPLGFLNYRYPIAIPALIYLLFDIYFLTTHPVLLL